MSINQWRYVESDHDGVSVFQCLNCYDTWSLRGNLEWNKWQFCPLCGVCWEGQQKWDVEKKYRYPEKRLEHPYEWILQERTLFSSHTGEWKDTWNRWCVSYPQGVYTDRTVCKDIMERWKIEVETKKAEEKEEYDDWLKYQQQKHQHRADSPHESYSPFILTQLRLILRRIDGSEGIVLQYLPERDKI